MVMVRKECFNRIGLFDENLPAGQDWDMWIRLAKHYQFDYINEPLVFGRFHEKRISTNPCAKMQGAKLMFKKFSPDLKTADNHRKILGHWHYRFGRLYSECGDMRKGRAEFIKAIIEEPYSAVYYARLFASFFGFRIYNVLRRLLARAILQI